MCVLCDSGNLRLLTSPAESLSHLALADSIHVSREAAMQFVLDTIHDLRESPGRIPSLEVSPEEYIHYVVDRAEEDGVATPAELREWSTGVHTEYASDPRVQAFVSSAVEGLARYLAKMDAQRETIARFLEARPEQMTFAGVGVSGELYFLNGGDAYAALTETEAEQIAADRVSWNLFREDPALLMRYTDFPEGALDILIAAQTRPEDEANQVLAGMVDVDALAADTLRQRGYGWLVAEAPGDVISEQRFGEQMIVRFRFIDEADAEG
jgi:hypothetical protein